MPANKNLNSFIEASKQTNIQYSELQKSLINTFGLSHIKQFQPIISASLTESFGFNIDELTNLQKSFVTLQKMLNTATNGIDESIVSSVLSPDWTSTVFDPLLAKINNIRIFSDYVEVPKQLIPEDYSYEKGKNSEPNTLITKLSHPAALALITGILVPTLLWIASCLMNLSPSDWQEKYHEEEMEALNTIIHREEEQLQLQRDETLLQQKQLEAILKTIEYLSLTSEELEATSPTFESAFPESHFLPEHSGSDTATLYSSDSSNLEVDSKLYNNESN